MLRMKKAALYASASALVLGMAIASPANAFDKIDWDWDNEIDQDVNVDVDIYVDVDPSGLVQVEKLQISLGNKSAESRLDSFVNIPHMSFDDGITHTTTIETEGEFGGGFVFSGIIKDEEIKDLDGDVDWHGDIDLDPRYQRDIDPFFGGGHFGGSYSETTDITVAMPDPVNALKHLPVVEVSAVALGNSESITSDVAVMVNEGQFTIGAPTGNGGGTNGTVEVPVELAVEGSAEGYIDIDASGNNPNQALNIVGIAGSPAGESVTEGGVEGFNGSENPLEVSGTATGTINVPVLGSGDWVDADNEHVALADTMLSLALEGLITPAQMTAASSAGLIVNAQADISATSIANNHAITLDAASEDDAIVVADLVQFAYADNAANAYLGSHVVSNYVNLGKLEDALTRVSSVAAGNISNIEVSSFAPDLGDDVGGGSDTD